MQMKIAMIVAVVGLVSAPVFAATVADAAQKTKKPPVQTQQTQPKADAYNDAYNYAGSDQQRWLDRAAAATNQQ